MWPSRQSTQFIIVCSATSFYRWEDHYRVSPSLLFSKPDKPNLSFFIPHSFIRLFSSGLHRTFPTAEVPRPDTALTVCVFSVPSCASVWDEVCYQKDKGNRNRVKGRPGGQEMFCLQGSLKWDLNGTMNHSAGSSAAGYFLGHIRFREPI